MYSELEVTSTLDLDIQIKDLSNKDDQKKFWSKSQFAIIFWFRLTNNNLHIREIVKKS